jgi:hypothetical protein
MSCDPLARGLTPNRLIESRRDEPSSGTISDGTSSTSAVSTSPRAKRCHTARRILPRTSPRERPPAAVPRRATAASQRATEEACRPDSRVFPPTSPRERPPAAVPPRATAVSQGATAEAYATTWLIAFVALRRACRRWDGCGAPRLRLSLTLRVRKFLIWESATTPYRNSTPTAIVDAIEIRETSVSVMRHRSRRRASGCERAGLWTAKRPVDQRSMALRALVPQEI